MLVCTLATYRYHIPLRLDAMPVLPPALVDACSPVFRRYQAGLSTRIRLRPSLEPVLKNSANYALNTVLILDVAAAEPVRVRNEWPAPNDLRMGSMKPYSFAEVRCEAHIGWTGMRDDELVEEGGPCEAPQMEGEGQDWKCIGVCPVILLPLSPPFSLLRLMISHTFLSPSARRYSTAARVSRARVPILPDLTLTRFEYQLLDASQSTRGFTGSVNTSTSATKRKRVVASGMDRSSSRALAEPYDYNDDQHDRSDIATFP